MSNEIGKKSLDMGKGKWKSAQPGEAAGEGPQVSEGKDSELQSGFHDRTFNPVDGATRGNVSSNLNADAARYKKGPGPL